MKYQIGQAASGIAYMDIIREFSENGTILKMVLTGDLTFEKNLNFINSYIDIPSKVVKFVVDFKRVNYMDSSALGLLLLMKNFGQENGVTAFELINCNSTVKGILHVSEFDQLFDIR